MLPAVGLCRRPSLRFPRAWDFGEADDLTREVSQYLQRKAEVLLTSSERPPWEDGEEAPPKRKVVLGRSLELSYLFD